MEGFKSNPKMQCFKEGGSVKYESRKEHAEEMSADINQDKKIVKKAIAMHDKQEHKGEKTDLSKLRNGGRAKKEAGSVKKFEKASGEYGAKKDATDKKNIKEAKQFKPVKLCGGKSVKKMADGGMAGQGAISSAERAAMQSALPGGQRMGSANDMERRRMMERAKNAMKYLGPAQQSEFVNQGGMGSANAPSAPVNQLGGTPGASNMGAPVGSTIPAQKRGGKIKKACK